MFIYFILVLSLVSMLAFALPKRAKMWSTMAIVAMGTVVSLANAIGIFMYKSSLFQTSLPLPFANRETIYTDGLTAFFTVLVSMCALGVVIYSRGFLSKMMDQTRSIRISIHYFSMSLLYLSLLMVLSFSDGYCFLMGWELMGLSSFLLMLLNANNNKVRRAALNYVVLMHIGFVFLLSGFSLVSASGFDFGFTQLGAYSQQYSPLLFFCLVLVGFGMKAGLFPLHGWMPASYSSSPDYVSAFMSGAVSKMGLYGMIRVAIQMQSDLLTIAIILLSVGAVTGLWGVLFCCLKSNLKRILAYSSIENMGIMFIGLGASVLGLAVENNMLMVCSLGGTLLHATSHSFLKTLLFFSAGNVISQTETGVIERMGGILRRMPISSALFLIGTLAICALPPLSGFASEFVIYYGLLDTVCSGADAMIISLIFIVVLSLIGGVALLAFTKLYGVVFLGVERTDCVEDAEEVDSWRLGACAISVAGILSLGFLPAIFGSWALELGSQLWGVTVPSSRLGELSSTLSNISLTLGVLVIFSVLIFLWRRYLLKGRSSTLTQTWGCAFTNVNARMQYSGESFAEGISTLAPLAKGSSDENATVSKNEFFPQKHKHSTHHNDKVDSLFETWWISFMRRLNSRVMSIRTGKVNYQVLYALIFLVLILILTLFNLI